MPRECGEALRDALSYSSRIDGDVEVGRGQHSRRARAMTLQCLISLLDAQALTAIGIHKSVVVVVIIGLGQETDGQRLAFVGLLLHLVDVPVTREIGEVDSTDVRADALDFLCVPEGEGIVVAVAEEDGIRLTALEIVAAHVAGDGTTRSVVVIPVLPCHLYGDEQEHQRSDTCSSRRDGDRCVLITGLLRRLLGEIAAGGRSDSSHTEAHPDSEGVERSHISVVTLTGLTRILVEVKHDGDTRHEEEHEGHPEALHPTTPATDLEEEPDEPEDQREGVVDIVPLIARHILGVRIAIPVEEAIDEGNTRSSATTQEAAVTLKVILAPSEVPHEVAPVHVGQLIVEEVGEVLPEGRLRHIIGSTPHPRIVHLRVTTVIDTGEEHHARALIDGLILGRTCYIAVGVRRLSLIDTAVGRLTFVELRAAVGAVLIGRREGRTVEERCRAILLTRQIVAEREGISRCILIHRRVSHRTHEDHPVGGEAHSDSHERHLYRLDGTCAKTLI